MKNKITGYIKRTLIVLISLAVIIFIPVLIGRNKWIAELYENYIFYWWMGFLVLLFVVVIGIAMIALFEIIRDGGKNNNSD